MLRWFEGRYPSHEEYQRLNWFELNVSGGPGM